MSCHADFKSKKSLSTHSYLLGCQSECFVLHVIHTHCLSERTFMSDNQVCVYANNETSAAKTLNFFVGVSDSYGSCVSPRTPPPLRPVLESLVLVIRFHSAGSYIKVHLSSTDMLTVPIAYTNHASAIA